MRVAVALIVGVLAQATALANAFLAAPLRRRGTYTPVAPLSPPPATISALPTAPSATAAPSGGSGTSNALLAGTVMAMVAGVLSSRKARGSRLSMLAGGGWVREPAGPGMERRGDPSTGPAYKTWMNLRRQSMYGNGRMQRFYRQQKILKESGITCASYPGWTKWYPNRDEFNLYYGPESHPDNRHFPAPSGGIRVPGTPRALPVPAAAPASASTFVAGRVPTFGTAKRAVRDLPRHARSGLVLHAHKKAASSTKNQGKTKNPHHWGITTKGYQGNAVKCGQVLVRQSSMKWYPGTNVKKGRDFTLNATADGIVQWRGDYKHREVFVVPWEYVRTRCQWINPNTLGPVKYEPWMGSKDYGKRHNILKLRREWLQTEEGKAWMAKKKEKEAKQKEIQKKIRIHTYARRYGPKDQQKPKESVDAGADTSDGESEK